LAGVGALDLPRTELREGGVHFTPRGYAILAGRLLPQVRAALAQRP
jgi:lysophospholipase L1-like esterase